MRSSCCGGRTAGKSLDEADPRPQGAIPAAWGFSRTQSAIYSCFSRSNTLVHTRFANAMLWVTATRPIPRFSASAKMRFQIWAWVITSSIVLISSQMRRGAPLIKARATQKRWSSPPESSRGNRSSHCASMPKEARTALSRDPLYSSTCRSLQRGLMARSGCW